MYFLIIDEAIKKQKAQLAKTNYAFGGLERIRTAVEAFAELCLATRPQDPFVWNAKLGIHEAFTKFFEQKKINTL